jgi:hypothetical protein
MIRIKSKEYAETILHFKKCLMTLKGQDIKNQMGDFKLAVEVQLSTFNFQ